MPQDIPYVLDIGTRMIRGGVAGDMIPTVECSVLTNNIISSVDEGGQKSMALAKDGEAYDDLRRAAWKDLTLFEIDPCAPIIVDGRIMQLNRLKRLLLECFKRLNFSLGASDGQSLMDSDDLEWTISGRSCSLMICMSSFSSPLISIMGSPSCRSNTLQELLEWCFSIGFKRCQLVSSPLMSVFAVGATSGLVIDVGYESSRVTPIAEGQCLSEMCQTRLMKGGRYITEQLHHALDKRCIRFATPYCILERIKQKHCFVSLDLRRDLELEKCTSAFHREWYLPDNTRIVLGKERFMAPEPLLCSSHPTMFVEGHEVLPDIIGEAIQAAPLDLRRPLLKSIILSGGGSLLPGFAARIEMDIRQWYSVNIMNRPVSASSRDLITSVIAPPDRDWLPFRGAALFAQYKAANADSWVTRHSYESKGMSAFYANWLKSIL